MIPLKAMLFDFDGVIVDTEPAIYQAWKELYDDYGQQLSVEEWRGTVGTRDLLDPGARLAESIGTGAAGAALLEAIADARSMELALDLDVAPGVLEWVEGATRMGIPLGVVSSSHETWVRAHLDARQLTSKFTAVVCWTEGRRPKPHPELYLLALSALGVRAADSIAIEDSQYGLAAAVGAGIPTVAVPSELTKAMDFSAAQWRFRQLSDVSLGTFLGGRY